MGKTLNFQDVFEIISEMRLSGRGWTEIYNVILENPDYAKI